MVNIYTAIRKDTKKILWLPLAYIFKNTEVLFVYSLVFPR